MRALGSTECDLKPVVCCLTQAELYVEDPERTMKTKTACGSKIKSSEDLGT